MPKELYSPDTIAVRDPTGAIIQLDPKTLAPVAVSSHVSLALSHYDLLEERFLPGTNQPILVPPSTPEHFLLAIRDRYTPYNALVVDLICQRISEGEALTKICGTYGFPSYATFCKWKRAYPEIEDLLVAARRDRAEFLRDQAMDIALNAKERDVESSSLKHQAYRWAAQMDDRDRFSPQSKVSVENTQPVQIIVQTGIQTVAAPVQTYDQALKSFESPTDLKEPTPSLAVTPPATKEDKP